MRVAGDRGNIENMEWHPFGAHVEKAVVGGIWVSEKFATSPTIQRTSRPLPEDEGTRENLSLQFQDVVVFTQAKRAACLVAHDRSNHDIPRPFIITFGQNTRSTVGNFRMLRWVTRRMRSLT